MSQTTSLWSFLRKLSNAKWRSMLYNLYRWLHKCWYLFLKHWSTLVGIGRIEGPLGWRGHQPAVPDEPRPPLGFEGGTSSVLRFVSCSCFSLDRPCDSWLPFCMELVPFSARLSGNKTFGSRWSLCVFVVNSDRTQNLLSKAGSRCFYS